MDLATLEAHKTVGRYYKQQDRIATQQGPGATDAGMAITKEYLGELAVAVGVALEARGHRANTAHGFELLLRKLDLDKVALATLQGCLHSIGLQEKIRDTLIAIGSLIEAECWAAQLTYDNPQLAERIAKRVRLTHGAVKYRKQAARSVAAANGFKQKFWKRDLKLAAGSWLLNVALATLPHVFTIVGSPGPTREERDDAVLTLMPEAEEKAAALVNELMQRHPVFLPMRQEPLPWTAWASGGPRDQMVAYAATVTRTGYKDVISSTKHAIKTGAMAPALDALNSLQSVAWTINGPVLDVMRECLKRGLDVPGFPGENIPRPAKIGEWDDLDAGQKRLWKMQAERVAKANHALVGDRLLVVEDMETADRMQSWERFYTPMNLDWRGRIYSMCNFHFQREDRVRGLFLFANGEPIGTDGLWWLKVHLANCGDFEKVSKKPLEERVQWVDENIHWIMASAKGPIEQLSKWTMADKPFLFLAACLELTAALENGPTFVSRLPISFDGSCSGLQHLCAMTRAPEGSLVNLTPSPLPQDVYATVASRVLAKVSADVTAEIEEDKEWVPVVAKLALEFGIDRKTTKRNVMTYSYSSKRFGMAAQQQTDLMDVLDEDVLTGKRGDHPFATYAQGRTDHPSVAARYLANHVYASIEEIINLPAQAMTFLQKLAKALAHEGKPLRWTTPTGLPWVNRYHNHRTERLKLYLCDKGVPVRRDVVVANGDEREINKEKAAAGVAPNFVHALDAAHLSLTVNAATAAGITALATVHDSFGCLASRARRFNEIIREEFIRMYTTHDVLQEALEQARRDLTPANWNRLPEVPQYGALDLTEVTHAQFAFA